MNQESRKCCNRPSKYHVIYDCGLDDQDLTLCDYHYNLHEAFKKNIKSIEEIKN